MNEPQPSVGATPPCDEQVLAAPVSAPLTPARVQPERAAPPAPEPETPEAAAERERRYREIFGIPSQEPADGGDAEATVSSLALSRNTPGRIRAGLVISAEVTV
jgi:hypothetical protein